MTALGREISLAVIHEYGPEELLKRLSDPFWFQALGCVLGFDWHSSGVTTTVCGALKEGLKGLESDTGIYVCGGKGGRSRKTPEEIAGFTQRMGLDGDRLIHASRMSAKVDSSAVQDGYQIYHHNFFFTRGGVWCVVQQGMNDETGYARRYHWLSSSMESFICEPHAAVCAGETHDLLNMVASESEGARTASVDAAREKPERWIRELKNVADFRLPERHRLLIRDLDSRYVRGILAETYERQPVNYESLLGLKGVGPKTVRALSLIAEVVYGAKPPFRDPARYSFAHGGKDGIPYPVNRERYDESIGFLRQVVNRARVDVSDKRAVFRRLARFSGDA